MTWELEYPLFLVPLEAGYVSVVEPSDTQAQTYYLAVFTTEQAAEEFIRGCGIESDPRELQNPREFAWLLQSLRNPVDRVAFDPLPDSTTVDSPWKVTVGELLAEHIVVDYSPWNYPIFVIQQRGGFVSVEGSTSEGEEMRAVGFFTRQEKAEAYLGDAGEEGTIVPLETLQQTRDFLHNLSPSAAAVALDLVIVDGNQSAKYCFSIPTILEKYLVKKTASRRAK